MSAPIFAPIVKARSIRFIVYGKPEPQGSARAVPVKGYARPFITSDNKKLKPWRQQISGAAVALRVEKFDRDVPLALSIDFYFARPASAQKRQRPTVKPDGDKLLRACADAMTGILYGDDAQIVSWCGRKFYGDPQRIEVTVTEILYA